MNNDAISKNSDARPAKLRGLGRKYLRGRIWWVEYGHRGTMHRESTRLPGAKGERAADRLLKDRQRQMGRGTFVGPSEERVKLAELLDALKLDYTNNGRRSLWSLEYRLAALRTAFAGERALDVTEDRIERYKAARLAEGYKPASVNRELAALRR